MQKLWLAFGCYIVRLLRKTDSEDQENGNQVGFSGEENLDAGENISVIICI